MTNFCNKNTRHVGMVDKEMNTVNQQLLFTLLNHDIDKAAYRWEVVQMLDEVGALDWFLEAYAQDDRPVDVVLAEYVLLARKLRTASDEAGNAAAAD